MLEIELFDHWTMYKKMTDVRDTYQYIELFNLINYIYKSYI